MQAEWGVWELSPNGGTPRPSATPGCIHVESFSSAPLRQLFAASPPTLSPAMTASHRRSALWLGVFAFVFSELPSARAQQVSPPPCPFTQEQLLAVKWPAKLPCGEGRMPGGRMPRRLLPRLCPSSLPLPLMLEPPVFPSLLQTRPSTALSACAPLRGPLSSRWLPPPTSARSKTAAPPRQPLPKRSRPASECGLEEPSHAPSLPHAHATLNSASFAGFPLPRPSSQTGGSPVISSVAWHHATPPPLWARTTMFATLGSWSSPCHLQLPAPQTPPSTQPQPLPLPSSLRSGGSP